MTRLYGTVLLTAVLAGWGLACSDSAFTGDQKDNQPPQVWLSAAPPEGSTGKYTVQLFWGGWDPDGEISHYEYLITNNTTGVFNPADTTGSDWMPVLANDSTFTFSADSLSDPGATSQIAEFHRSHTFFIRAIDDEGMRSIEAVHRSFTARTLSPRVSIQVPRRNQQTPADVPPITTYRWEATDYVSDLLSEQEPDSVQWALVPTSQHGGNYERTIEYLRTADAEDEWYPWVWYRAPQDSGKFWTTPPTEFGNYVFAIRAKDEAGAVTPVLDETQNVRRVRVSRRTTGPLLTVNNIYLGRVLTTSCSTPVAILDLPSGVPVEFDITATADFYGGTVSGYRYGWDITDLKDPDAWEVDLTPFVGSVARVPSRSFFLGTHLLTVEVVDNSGFCSRAEIKLNVVQFTMEQNVLVVDDFRADENSQAGWDNSTGRGVVPTDAQHDEFWADMLADVEGFDPVRDVANPTAGAELPLTLFANYKNIIWSAYGDPGQQADFPLLYRYIQYRSKNPTGTESSGGTKVTPNILALFMAAGGHAMITGRTPVQNVIKRGFSPRFPFIWLYELEGAQGRTQIPDPEDPLIGDQSFAYKELCLETLDLAVTSTQRRRAQQQYCPVTFIRVPNLNSVRDDSMREAAPLDSRFPVLTLRPEAAAAGKFYDPAVQGFEAEVYNPAYFRRGGACDHVPTQPRGCFEPIYGLTCFDTAEPTYMQPVAFFTSAFADRVAEVPGAIGARSVVWGFAPVFFKPAQVKPALEVILFDEWQLPRKADVAASE